MSQPEPDAFSLAYAELHRLAQRYMAGERRDHTLQPTALVHEAWGRLAGRIDDVDEVHFKAVVATTMRRVLVDHARRKRGPVHGGGVPHVPLTVAAETDANTAPEVVDVLDLDAALTQLAQTYPVPARIVEARFFAGMTHPEIAAAMGLGLSTVEGHWRFARAWLRSALGDGGATP